MKMKAKKPRKQVDSTMRNVRAANKRIKALEDRVDAIYTGILNYMGAMGWEQAAVRREFLPKRGRK